MDSDYIQFDFEGNGAYVRKDRVDMLTDVDAAIFDCDGVLIDIRDSYDRAISETVSYILGKFTGYPFPSDMLTNEIIFLFRKSGGFNNDWDTCYGILMFILSNLPADLQEIHKVCIKGIRRNDSPRDRLQLIEDAVKQRDANRMLTSDFVTNQVNRLRIFARNLDESGVLSVDKNLQVGLSGEAKDNYEALKCLLYSPPEFGESIVPTVFDEIFCGHRLLKDVYGVEPVFHTGRGLIENERTIIRLETLSQLAVLFGKANFGLASGSRFKTAAYVLGEVLDFFSPNSLLFLDDIEREEEKILKSTGKMVNLKKPKAFSLCRAAEGLNAFKAALYVGDSIEDAFMAHEARKEDPRIMFAGVYQFSGSKEALLESLFEIEADLILPSVNEIPSVLGKLKERKRR